MRALIAVIGFLAAISAASCSMYNNEENSMSAAQYINYLQERRSIERFRNKFAQICPGKNQEFNTAFFAMKKCSDDVDERNETACSSVRNHFLRCSKPFIELFDDCLPQESKGVSKLVFDSVLSAALHLCRTDGEHIFELADTCVLNSDTTTRRCERRVATKLQQFKKNSPSKMDICEWAQSLKPCLHNHLMSSCRNRITRESFMGMFEALMAPCKEISNTVEYNWVENEVELLE